MADSGHPHLTPPTRQNVPSADRAVIPWARPILAPLEGGRGLSPPLPASGLPEILAPGQGTGVPDRHPLLLAGLSRGQAVVDGAIVIALWIAIEVVFMVLALPTSAQPLDSTDEWTALRNWLVPLTVARAVFLGGAIMLLTRWHRLPFASIGLTLRNAWLFALLGAGLCGVIFMLLIVMVLVLSLIPGLAEELRSNPEQIMQWMPRLSIAGYLGLAVTVGFHEELLFRGFLMPRLRRLTGSWLAAVLLSGALFTLLHMGEQRTAAMIPIAMLSFIFSIVTIITRSLIPSVVAHALFDFMQFVFISTFAATPLDGSGAV